jgi:hypothetical protein
MIIPDSIQPYIGYKALLIENGVLKSPSYETVWPVGQRLEASCPIGGNVEWVKREGCPSTLAAEAWKPAHRGSPHHHGRPAQLWTSSTTYVIPNIAAPFEHPEEHLPEGWYWSLEVVAHAAGEPECTCGIYVVQDIQRTFGYMRPNGVVCQIALWGQTTVANRGARGQYAYPQKIYLPEHLIGVGSEIAEKYEIPTEMQKFTTGYEPYEIRRQAFFASERAQQKQDATAVALFFGVLAVMASMTGLIVNYVFNAPPACTLGMAVFSLLFALVTLVASADARKS